MKLPVHRPFLPPVGRMPTPVATKHTTVQASAVGDCYFHHTCPDDGRIVSRFGPPFTKRQCQRGGGKSWMSSTGCINFD